MTSIPSRGADQGPRRGRGSPRWTTSLHPRGPQRSISFKLDVDGYECDVLDGAVGTLARHQPTIVAEIAPHALEAMGHTVDDLLDRLAEPGYRLERLRGEKPVRAADIVRLRNERRSINVIARGPRPSG